MPLDDDDKKIRRNLVVYSSLLLVLTWLDLPLGLLLEETLPKGLPKPQDYKLWALGFAVLAYLGIRFAFSSEGKQYEEACERDYSSILFAKCVKLAQLAATTYSWFGYESSLFQESVSTYVQRQGNTIDPESLSKCGRPQIELAVKTREMQPWDFTASSTVTWKSGRTTRATVSGGYTMDIRIQGVWKLIAICWAKAHAWAYTDSAIRYLAPLVLGLGAASVLWVKVVLAYAAT